MRFQEGEIPAVPLGWWAGRRQEGSHMEVGAGFPGLPLHEPGKTPKLFYSPLKVSVRWLLVSWSLGKTIILRNYLWHVVFEQSGF